MTPCYTIHDLARETGYSARRISKLIYMGVVSPALPPQDGVQGIRYSSLHLNELRQVRDIQDSNMTLADIRDRLHPEDEDDE